MGWVRCFNNLMQLQGGTTPEDALTTCRGLTSDLAVLVALVQRHLVLVVEEASALQFPAVRFYTARKNPSKYGMRTV